MALVAHFCNSVIVFVVTRIAQFDISSADSSPKKIVWGGVFGLL